MPDSRPPSRHQRPQKPPSQHWRVDGAVYFITWRQVLGADELSAAERKLIADVIKSGNGARYRLQAYVVMHDHVHVLVAPRLAADLTAIVNEWRSSSAARMSSEYNRRGHVWQREYFDRMMRTDEEREEKAQYIMGNPYAKWPAMKSYPWAERFDEPKPPAAQAPAPQPSASQQPAQQPARSHDSEPSAPSRFDDPPPPKRR